jgi:general secretion pathway protein D
MKRFHCGCLILLVALIANVPAIAASDDAKKFYNQGRHAEARQQYDEAYQFFKKAYDLQPEVTDYRSSFERLKFLAAAGHVHRGQQLRDDGKLTEALKEFQTAAMIDPSSAIAQQEIRRTQRVIDQAQHPEQAPPANLPASSIPQGLSGTANMAGPVQLAPISQTPLTLKLYEDSKTIYETIGKLAGINVLFDPDYAARRIRIELNGVSLEQALQIVALESRTFWRPVTPNTIYVAADTQQKRAEIEQQVLRTFYLANFSTVSELQDVTNLIRTILRVERVQQFPAENAIVMRGTPDQAALAELLINNLDKAKPEVVVDMVVMQVSKNKLRQLGIQWPFQGGTTNPTITFQSPTVTNNTTTGTGTTTGNTTTNSGLTLNSLANLNATDFAVSIPASNIAFLMTDSNTNVIQRPQIRSVDGQKATLKIGQRVPIAVGTSSSTLTATALTQTQFQYQDVGVNIELTPHIHTNTDVSLRVSLEVSAIDSFQTIGGLTEPVIGQRKIDHEIRMRDGEVSLIGGMMEHDDVRNMSGLPWLSEIPVLKYLFGQSQKSKTDNETVFALMPHVVRRLDLEQLNIRPVDIGTQNVVEVRHISETREPVPPTVVPSGVPSPAPTAPPPAGTVVPGTVTPGTVTPGAVTPGTVTPGTPGTVTPGTVTPAPGAAAPDNTAPAPSPGASNAAPATGVMKPPAASEVTAATPPPSPSIPSAGTAPSIGPVLSLDPPIVNQPAGATFSINVVLNGGQDVFSVPVQVRYDPKVMQFLYVSNGGALSKDGAAVAVVHRDDSATGTLQVSLSRPPGSGGVAPTGTLMTLTFMTKAPGQGSISIGKAVLRDPKNTAIDASGSQAMVNVR